jgi:phage tail P2-like protein
MDLENIDLLSLQTTNMKQDLTTIAMCNALTPKFKQLASETKSVLIYSRIDELDDASIDELAYQMHIDFYSTSLQLEVKRQVVKNSLRWHRIKGTPAAVEEAAKVVFGRSWVTEWHEYSGNPYMFKVNVEASNRGASPEDLKLLEKLINAYKNKRSWLEVINIFLTTNGSIFLGGCINSGEDITVYPWSPKEAISVGTVNLGIGNQFVETTIIYPKEMS